MENLGIRGLGADAQVPDDQRFEQQAEELEVGGETIGSGSEGGDGQGRIDEVSNRRPAASGSSASSASTVQGRQVMAGRDSPTVVLRGVGGVQPQRVICRIISG